MACFHLALIGIDTPLRTESSYRTRMELWCLQRLRNGGLDYPSIHKHARTIQHKNHLAFIHSKSSSYKSPRQGTFLLISV